MKFEEAIKMVGKQYIQEEIKCREENDITIKLPGSLTGAKKKIISYLMKRKKKI